MVRSFLTGILIGAIGLAWSSFKLQAQESARAKEPEKEIWFENITLSFRDYCKTQAKMRFLLALDQLKEEKQLNIRQVQAFVAAYETCSQLDEVAAEKYLQGAIDRLFLDTLLEDQTGVDLLEKHLFRLWKDTGYLAITKKPIYHDPNGWYRNYEKASLFEKRWMIDTIALQTQAAFMNGYLLQEEIEKLDPQVLLDMQYRVKVQSTFSSLAPITQGKRSHVALIQNDLIDSACELDEKGANVLVVLNGQGLFPWKGALGIQQDLESLLERTTALVALDPSINKKLADQLAALNAFALHESVIYLPHVHVLRKSLGSGFAFSSLRRLDFLVTYENDPDPSDFNEDLSDADARKQMRSILRAAHHKGHRSLVLSVRSLQANEHNAKKIAQAWYDVLGEREFLGQFSQISLVFDLSDEATFPVFKERFTSDRLLVESGSS